MTTIIVKDFKAHYNSALGKVIKNERQYKEELKRGNYIPYEQAKEITASNMEKRNKFRISDDALAWMKSVKNSADRKGNVKLSGNQIDFLKEKGTITNRENSAFKEALDSRLPEHYR